jgi:ABC-type nitrate/sulfonate/bicarbonate transport system permease component
VHTPFELSLYRTIAGAVIGGAIGIVGGLIVMWVYGLAGRWMRKKQ